MLVCSDCRKPVDLGVDADEYICVQHGARRADTGVTTIPCPMCGDGGWTLDSRPHQEPQCLELIPCIYPTCEESGKPVAVLSMKGPRFNSVSRHPVDDYVMSLAACEPTTGETP